MNQYYSVPLRIKAFQVDTDKTVPGLDGMSPVKAGSWVASWGETLLVLTDEEFHRDFKTARELQVLFDTLSVVPGAKPARGLRSKTYARVQAILKGGAMTTAQLIEALGDLNSGTLRNTLVVGKKRLLWKYNDGRWHL